METASPRPMPCGTLPPWSRDELPEPLPFSPRNLLRVIGPGAILLAASIGGGEWLVGPATTVQYGLGILWVATTAIGLQLLFNLEAIRYTLYTGEPIFTGLMRLWPGSKFWGAVYIVLGFAQLSVPALAKGCATPLFSMFWGRMPQEGDAGTLLALTYGVMAVGIVILLSGKTIERTLEVVSWGMILFIFLFLLFVNLWFVPFGHWWKTLTGFASFGHLPSGMDPMLLGTFAATAGSGGLGNLVIASWVRDKGFGMGGRVGAIESALTCEHHGLAHVGKFFVPDERNLPRWRTWWRYVVADQVYVWAVGCFGGMFLNVNLVTHIAAPGTDLTTIGAGAFQAQYMAEKLWSGFWFLALLNGFWILFSTHLGNTDTLVRSLTDILWVANDRIRTWRNGSSRLYYSLLAVLTVWGGIAVRFGSTMQLFKILGIVALPIMVLGAIQILRVNTTLLPRELRPPLWRRGALLVCAAFYGLLTAFALADMFGVR